MARMSEFAQQSIKNGTLISTGPLGRRETGGARVSLAKGNVTVQPGAQLDSTLMRAAGYALIRATSREEAIRQVSEFMAVAGDGEVEILEVPEMPAPH
jgi:hypothetical protein